MNEREIKGLCKFLIEYGDHNYPYMAKELLKMAIDLSSTWQELVIVAMTSAALKMEK